MAAKPGDHRESINWRFSLLCLHTQFEYTHCYNFYVINELHTLYSYKYMGLLILICFLFSRTFLPIPLHHLIARWRCAISGKLRHLKGTLLLIKIIYVKKYISLVSFDLVLRFKIEICSFCLFKAITNPYIKCQMNYFLK